MVEDWDTSRLDGKCPSQVSDVYNRPVCFQVCLVNVHGLPGGGVQVLQDKMVTVLGKTRSVTNKL